MPRWTPQGKDPATFHNLVDGVPPWLMADLKEWLDHYVRLMHYEAFLRGFDKATRRIETVSRLSHYDPSTILQNLPTDDRLDFIEYFLFWLQEEHPSALPEASEVLDEALAESSSKWRVGRRDGNVGLEDRVPQGVADALDEVVEHSGTAGELLAEAWVACFGREPDYEEAYEKAIKAVEEAGAEVVAPRNDRTTLGTMARDMENQGNWLLPLGNNSHHSTDAMPTEMVRALWEGQESRHGGNGYRKPTREEAESAVLLAVPLVQWFTSGVLIRRS